jgi:hypothetical protein
VVLVKFPLFPFEIPCPLFIHMEFLVHIQIFKPNSANLSPRIIGMSPKTVIKREVLGLNRVKKGNPTSEKYNKINCLEERGYITKNPSLIMEEVIAGYMLK